LIVGEFSELAKILTDEPCLFFRGRLERILQHSRKALLCISQWQCHLHIPYSPMHPQYNHDESISIDELTIILRRKIHACAQKLH